MKVSHIKDDDVDQGEALYMFKMTRNLLRKGLEVQDVESYMNAKRELIAAERPRLKELYDGVKSFSEETEQKQKAHDMLKRIFGRKWLLPLPFQRLPNSSNEHYPVPYLRFLCYLSCYWSIDPSLSHATERK